MDDIVQEPDEYDIAKFCILLNLEECKVALGSQKVEREKSRVEGKNEMAMFYRFYTKRRRVDSFQGLPNPITIFIFGLGYSRDASMRHVSCFQLLGSTEGKTQGPYHLFAGKFL